MICASYWAIAFSGRAIYFAMTGKRPIWLFPIVGYVGMWMADAEHIQRSKKEVLDIGEFLNKAKSYIMITKDNVDSVKVKKSVLRGNRIILIAKDKKYVFFVSRKKLDQFIKLYEEFKTD